MKTQRKILVLVVTFFILLAGLAGWYLRRHPVPMAEPTGVVGHKELHLMIFTATLSLVVVIPVFAMLIGFALRYREGNPRGKYSPNLEGNRLAETIWWIIPAVMIGIIGTITWRSSYALDPFKPLASSNKTLHIQVVALDWKWLFIYPGQNIARVNVVDIPVGTPVEFDITSDTVMTSFWAPQLGGQMYAMPGMATKLNLRADSAGNYQGSAANISGKGFADMTFTVHALPSQAYSDWLQTMHRMPSSLTASAYNKLAQPGTLSAADVGMGKQYTYGSVEPELYDRIMLKYMTPVSGGNAVSSLGASS